MKYPKEELISMYRAMLTSRLFDEELIYRNSQGQLEGMIHLTLNQEAFSAALVHSLRPEDSYLHSHRCRPLHLIRIPIRVTLAEMVGLRSGWNGGIGGEPHTFCLEKNILPHTGSLGGGASMCAGYAYAMKRRRPGSAVVQLMGDGQFNQGMVHEALHWTAIMKLPMVYVVENNKWAMTTPDSQFKSGDNIADRARACGLETVVVDGQDILACREVADVALDRARTQCLPSFIEVKTYRAGGHFSGDTMFYANKELHEENLKKFPDPIPKYEAVLIENKVVTHEELKKIKDEVKKEMHEITEDVYQESLKLENRPTREDIVGRLDKLWSMPMEGLLA